jgi:ABC-2 type transport system permease protein
MDTQSTAMPENPVELQATAPAPILAPQPLYWSVRRELWENRSLWIAPVAVAGVILVGCVIGSLHFPTKLHSALTDPVHQRGAINAPYGVAAAMLIVACFVVGVFYCLDALYGERRDRTILFWKSLPVSDLTTVLSKACIPLLVLPVVTFAVIVATQAVMLLVGLVALPQKGVSVATLWADLPLFKMWLALLYSLAAIALWHAPIYGWLLLVSGSVRRAAFLWAVLPPFSIWAIEKVAFNTSYFADLLKDRMVGWFDRAYDPQLMGGVDPLQALAPGQFLSAPGLWIGLLFAAGLLVAAARLRRYREPI